MASANSIPTIEGILTRGVRRYARRGQKIQRLIDRLAVVRVVTFLALIAAISFAVSGDYMAIGGSASVVLLLLFLGELLLHDKLYRHLTRCRTRQTLYADDLNRINLDLEAVVVKHPMTFPLTHPFIHDLDFSGPNGLLKLIDCTHFLASSKRLQSWIEVFSTVAEVRERQTSAQELAPKASLRMMLRTRTYEHASADLDQRPEWLDLKAPFTANRYFLFAATLLALTATTLILMRFIFQIENIPWLPVSGLAFISYAFFGRTQRNFIDGVMKHRHPINATASLASILENHQFSSHQLQAIHHRYNQSQAGKQLGHLQAYCEGLNYRANGLAHFLLNYCTQWDAWYVSRIISWRQQHASQLLTWFKDLVEFEALSSLAHFNWLFPQFSPATILADEKIMFEANCLGHPLIAEAQRAGNDYCISGAGQIHLLTGSNMSGKSTFLRTVGANWVLAALGASVCAERLTCSLPRLWTSIRIQDSLNAGVSYFYAEVLRLKAILNAVQEPGRPVFFLLDEILRGTNSRERLIACKAIVEYLTKRAATGIITTHDLELLALADQAPQQIQKYHFRETISGDQMTFDYRLHPNELKSTNALRVIKAAGLPLEFETP